jgi:hypothetical protein
MDCPICGAIAEQIRTTIASVTIICPICGEFDVASSVVATGQLQQLEPDRRGRCLGQGEAFGAAWRSPSDHPLPARLKGKIEVVRP